MRLLVELESRGRDAVAWVSHGSTKLWRAVARFVKAHPLKTIVGAMIAGLFTFVPIAASVYGTVDSHITNEANLAPSLQLDCIVVANGQEPFPKDVLFVSTMHFIHWRKPGIVMNDGIAYEVGKTYAHCVVQNLGRAAYKIAIPFDVCFSPTENAATSFPTKGTIYVDQLGPTDKYDVAIADLSPGYFMHLHFGSKANASVQGIDKPHDYPLVSADSNNDVERFPFDVATRPYSEMLYMGSAALPPAYIRTHNTTVPNIR